MSDGVLQYANMDLKPTSVVSEPPRYSDTAAFETGASSTDAKDMLRTGKKQEFKRNFHFLSAFSFVIVFTATWEYVLTSLSVGFSSGGYAGLFWCFITTILCYSTIVASLAEMASMAPTCGGQYHWASEFAPTEYQRVLSYASGWMSTLAWLAGFASSNYICVAQIQAMIEVYSPGYTFTQWQYTLILIGFAVVTVGFNTCGAKVLPQLQVVCLVLHIGGFILIMAAVLSLAPKNSARQVFLDFQDNSGWNNIGVAYMISQVYVLYCNSGSDSVVHTSEEVGDASLVVPRCMWWSYCINTILGIAMLITMLFCIGPLDAVLTTDTPYLNLFNNTGSRPLSLIMNLIIFFMTYAGNIDSEAACAREVFAFARDKGIPFSDFIGHIDPKWSLPFNAVYVTTLGVIPLSCINFGSTLGFTILVSVGLLALLSTYLISIGCILLKRLRGEPLPPARWSWGRWGLPLNAFAFVYSAYIMIWCCFPPDLSVDYASANWSPLVWAGFGLLSLIWYQVHGKKHYTAPVEFVEGRKARGVELQTAS
ncbi:putative amino-acid permease C15C4.04c [Pseudocercospora fuligena]|uniref:Putative amino-acid permease C15C4.04c n=1 Tax=Pseudocercospora fuligena TaxID=685502 RepID=A0A8H6VGB3_9PEZI|nr:putative amino-acid permease C15C4.04c [Pseudocercospora fuligena]